MEAFQGWRTAVTRSLPGTIILAVALTTHVLLGLWKTARRSTWRMPIWEAFQIALALMIPVLLAGHASVMRAHHDIDGSATRYSEVLPGLWDNAALPQTLLLLIVWTHGCIGLHFWLRLSRYYAPVAPLLLVLAVLVPTLALSGFTAAGRQAAIEAQAKAASSAQTYDEYAAADPPSVGITAADVQTYAVRGAWTLLAALALTLAFRAALQLRHRRIRIAYAAGPTVTAPIGPTLLELSRTYRVPHTAVCGGRARCSTCRVRVDRTARDLPAMTQAEEATLKRIHADPDVRLACQLRPRGDLDVTRLVKPPDEKRPAFAADSEAAGVERTLAVLFLDIRGFTTLSEARLPYDTVFLLNRFFGEVGGALTASGGWIDKYLGDGLMALFGLNQSTEAACRAALDAAMRIDAVLDRLNRELGDEIASPLKIGIGLHVGPLVLGRIGHTSSAATTVIGPVVNVASRLESADQGARRADRRLSETGGAGRACPRRVSDSVCHSSRHVGTYHRAPDSAWKRSGEHSRQKRLRRLPAKQIERPPFDRRSTLRPNRSDRKSADKDATGSQRNQARQAPAKEE